MRPVPDMWVRAQGDSRAALEVRTPRPFRESWLSHITRVTTVVATQTALRVRNSRTRSRCSAHRGEFPSGCRTVEMLVLSPDCPSLRISPSRTGSQFHPCLSSLWDGAAWFSTDGDVSGRIAFDHRPIVRDQFKCSPLPGSRHRMAHSTGHLDVSGTPARLAVKRSALPGGCRIEDGVCDRNLLVLIDCDSHTPEAVSLDRDSSPSPHLSTPLSPYGPASSRASLPASS